MKLRNGRLCLALVLAVVVAGAPRPSSRAAGTPAGTMGVGPLTDEPAAPSARTTAVRTEDALLGDEQATPFAPGETLTYRVAWSAFSEAGLIRTSVKERVTAFGVPAFHIAAEGGLAGFLSRVYHAQYKADTVLDLVTLAPRESTLYGEEGRRRFTKTTRFDRAAGKARYEVASSPGSAKTLDVPPGTQDLLSVLYAFRAAVDYPHGMRAVSVAWNGRLYRADLAIEGQDWVATGLGTVRAWRLRPRIVNDRGQPENRKMTLWFSVDERHLPVRLKMRVFIGNVDIVLKDARQESG